MFLKVRLLDKDAILLPKKLNLFGHDSRKVTVFDLILHISQLSYPESIFHTKKKNNGRLYDPVFDDFWLYYKVVYYIYIAKLGQSKQYGIGIKTDS